MLKVAAEDAVQSRQVDQSLELIEDHEYPPIEAVGDAGWQLEERMDGGDWVACRRSTLKGEPAQRRGDTEAAKLAANHSSQPPRQTPVRLLEAHRHVGDTQNVAEVDKNARQLVLRRGGS